MPSGRPNLPPSPIPAPPAFDKSFDGSRFLITFTLDSKDADGNYILHAALQLNPASDTRFSSLRVNISLKEGTIVGMSEPIEASFGTESSHSLPFGAVRPMAAEIPTEASGGEDNSVALLQDDYDIDQFTSYTHNTVHTQGVGGRSGEWVLKEDSEDLAQCGLGPRIDLEATLDVRPVAIIFNVMVATRIGDGKERAIRSGTLNAYI